MKPRVLAVLCASAVLFLASSVFGVEEQPGEKDGNGMIWIILFGPTLFLIIYIVMLSRRAGSWKQGEYLAKAGDHMAKTEEHMANMERKADRMIQLLESIERRLGREE